MSSISSKTEREKKTERQKGNLVNRLNVGRLEGNNGFRGASFPCVPPTNLKGKSFHLGCPFSLDQKDTKFTVYFPLLTSHVPWYEGPRKQFSNL